MSGIVDLGEGVGGIRAPNPSPMTLEGTWSYLVGRTQPVIIDPGPADPGHLSAIENALGGAAPAAIILTHLHPDHSEAAPELSRRTGAPILAGRGALRFDQGWVARWVQDGDTLDTADGRLVVLGTPGHAPEHITPLWFPPAAAAPPAAAFVGDLLMGEGDTTLLAPPDGDVAAFFASLERLATAGATFLLPAHGPPIRDPDRAIARFRRHRESRLEQIRALLTDRPTASADDLLDSVYGSSLSPQLRPAAEASIQTMLDYLRPRLPDSPA